MVLQNLTKNLALLSVFTKSYKEPSCSFRHHPALLSVLANRCAGSIASSNPARDGRSAAHGTSDKILPTFKQIGDSLALKYASTASNHGAASVKNAPKVQPLLTLRNRCAGSIASSRPACSARPLSPARRGAGQGGKDGRDSILLTGKQISELRATLKYASTASNHGAASVKNLSKVQPLQTLRNRCAGSIASSCPALCPVSPARWRGPGSGATFRILPTDRQIGVDVPALKCASTASSHCESFC